MHQTRFALTDPTIPVIREQQKYAANLVPLAQHGLACFLLSPKVHAAKELCRAASSLMKEKHLPEIDC